MTIFYKILNRQLISLSLSDSFFSLSLVYENYHVFLYSLNIIYLLKLWMLLLSAFFFIRSWQKDGEKYLREVFTNETLLYQRILPKKMTTGVAKNVLSFRWIVFKKKRD